MDRDTQDIRINSPTIYRGDKLFKNIPDSSPIVMELKTILWILSLLRTNPPEADRGYSNLN